MPAELNVEAQWQGGWRFDALTGTGHTVVMDAAVEDEGTEAGARPMELLLVGIAGCTAMDVVSILKTMRQEVRSYRVKVTGRRRDDHPKVFTHILIEHFVQGDVSEDRLARAVELSNQKYCSAQAMMRGVAEIETRYEIERP
ncbi:MAG: OsmC family protein [Armatimonadetes bacterium]|nr:OsmC family protein [Armatimonadota bacterium]